MKYLKLYSDQASAIGQTIDTPNVCVLEGMDKTLFVPSSVGDKVAIIEDGDFIHYEKAIEFVDLGLSSGTKWMKCNIGAEEETDYGLYFQWGDTVGYSDASHSTWSTCPGNGGSSDYDEAAFATWKTTNLTDGVLNTSVDAVYQATNGKAKMPTQTQLQELVSGTNSEWTTVNGVAGRKFTNKTDSSKYIFIPAAGYVYGGSFYNVGSSGYVWSGSLNTSNERGAYDLSVGSGGVNAYFDYRYDGFPVRGVKA